MAKTTQYDRAKIVDEAFKARVTEGLFPKAKTSLSLADVPVKPHLLVELFETQLSSRLMDIRARELKNENRCFYTIGSSGHEGNAVFGEIFRPSDMAFLHYRSGAFMLQRSKKVPGCSGLYNMALSLAASADDPISGGRHKVFGSLELNIPPQTSTIASHLPKAVGAALSIARARDLEVEAELEDDGIVLCSFGDASMNHASAQSAFNTASWVAYKNFPVPLVFICEDNGVGISVPTPDNWVERNFENRVEIRYFQADGLNILDTIRATREVERYVRMRRRPAFLHMKTVRMLGHAGSDPEWSYHSFDRIEATESQDPLLHTARILIENNILNQGQVLDLYNGLKERIRHITDEACERPKLTHPVDVARTITANRKTRLAPNSPSEQDRKKVFGKEFDKLKATPQHMAKIINYGLTDIMLRYQNTLVFGEDVAKKGGVYNVTQGLQDKFTPRRVFNSPLDETSILGTAIGMAHNGFVPIPEIQFLAYVHNAEDQIRGEAATLPFFSEGRYTNPMVIRIPGLAYQKGFGGHFHNDNSLAIFRDIPGLILAVPSNGADAVRMMRTAVREAHENGRLVVFVEPIALYMTKDLHEQNDKEWSFTYPELNEETKLGELKVYGDSGDCVVLTYGNGVYHSLRAQKILNNEHKKDIKVVDLQWLAPLGWENIVQEVAGTKKIVIVDECRKTGSLSEGLVAGLIERLPNPPQIKTVTADDCFIPLGVAAASGLPQPEDVVKAVLS